MCISSFIILILADITVLFFFSREIHETNDNGLEQL